MYITHLHHELGVDGPVINLGVGLEASKGTQVHVSAQERHAHRVLLRELLHLPHHLGALSRVLCCSPVVAQVICRGKGKAEDTYRI